MKIALSNADDLFDKIYNDFLLNLLSRKEFAVFPGVYVTVPATIDFSLSRSADDIVVTMNNAKPTIRVGTKYLLQVTGIIEKIIIRNGIIQVSINGLPDLTIERA